MKIKPWIKIIIGIVITLGVSAFFIGNQIFWLILVIGLIAISLPFILSIILGQTRSREKEEKFLEFSRDLVENVKSGTPVGKGIVNLKNRDYGALSPHINKLANQLVLGITLTNALETFAFDSKSKTISRAIGLISQAERAGGKIDTILESVAKSVNQIENLRKERTAAVSNLVTQGYIIFMIFIVIMLILEFKILPLVSDLSSSKGLTVAVKNIDPESFATPLFIMILIQSAFAGLVIGKISEGTIKSGIKHSFVLIALTLLITTGARTFFG